MQNVLGPEAPKQEHIVEDRAKYVHACAHVIATKMSFSPPKTKEGSVHPCSFLG